MSFVYLDQQYAACIELGGRPGNRNGRFLIGFFLPNGSFWAVDSHNSPEKAEHVVHYLNGGGSREGRPLPCGATAQAERLPGNTGEPTQDKAGQAVESPAQKILNRLLDLRQPKEPQAAQSSGQV